MKTQLSLVGEAAPAHVLEQFEGVGLVRGEFVPRQLRRSLLEEDVRLRLREYLSWLGAAVAPHEVWYRTTDLWTDEANRLHGSAVREVERNPMLGLRGVRRARSVPDEFKIECETVAKACEAASNLRVQFPFVTDAEEFAAVAAAASAEGVPGPFGSMVEIPSAAVGAADILDAGADRLLVGVNDLSCLTTGSNRATGFDQKLHPAVWHLVDLAAEAAHARGRHIGIAGLLSPELISRAGEHGLDFVSVHYSQARDVLALGDEPWPDEDLERTIKLIEKESAASNHRK